MSPDVFLGRLAMSAFLVVPLACDSPPKVIGSAPSSTPTQALPSPSITAVSPESVIAGSGPVAVTISGGGFQGPSATHTTSFAVLSESELSPHLISDTELTATVPASLLTVAGVKQLSVVNGDSMGWADGYRGYPQSNRVTFTVVAPH